MTLGWTFAFGGSLQSACLSRDSPVYTGVSIPQPKTTGAKASVHRQKIKMVCTQALQNPPRESPELLLTLQRLLFRKPHHSSKQTTLQAEAGHTCSTPSLQDPNNPSETPQWGPNLNKPPVTLGANPSSALLMYTPMTDQSLRDS